MRIPYRIKKLLREGVVGRTRNRLSAALLHWAREVSIGRSLPLSALEVTERIADLPGAGIGLQVIFVQYDLKKYPRALERLVGVLSRFESVGYSILVVDNFRPGAWAHQLDDHVTQIGGDNSAWEFSAFDRGLQYLESVGSRAKAYAFVTDAFAAYGDSFLSLIDASLVSFVVNRKAAVGWVDAWPEETTLFGKRYQDWIRASFVLLSRDVLTVARPFAAPIDRAELFSGDAAHPFAATAPLGENLQRYLVEWLVGGEGDPALAESWHSLFKLDPTSLPFFEQKASAIMREHLLSVRLRDASVPCYDFRLLRRIRESGLSLGAPAGKTLARFEGSRWNAPDDAGLFRKVQSNIDHVELPQVTAHGEPGEAWVKGWVLSRPQPELVRLRLGVGKTVVAPCTDPREDVAEAFPGYDGLNCGFSIRASLADLPPGNHSVVLEIGSDRTVDIGQVEVQPAFSVRARRLAIPGSWPEGKPIPFSLEGELITSFRAGSFKVRVDGRDTTSDLFLAQGARVEGRPFVHEIAVNGISTALDAAAEHTLELVFTLSSGVERVWRHSFSVVTTDVPFTLRNLVVGPFDPDTALTTVTLDMDVFDTEAGDRIVLERAGVEILEYAIIETEGKGSNAESCALVTFERKVPGIPGGKSDLVLLLRRAHRRFVVWKGEVAVPYRHPEIHLDRFSAVLSRVDPPTYCVHVAGWIKNHFLVNCLIVEIRGSRRALIRLDSHRPDVAKALGSPLVIRQGFDALVDVTDVPPGEHVVHLIANEFDVERTRVSQRLEFEDTPSRRLSVTSDDLERLLHAQEPRYYSAIAIRGVVNTQMEQAVATLLVGDKLADEQILDGAGRHEFSLRAVPRQSGEYSVRFMVSSRGRVVFSTDPVTVTFQTLEFSDRLTRDLGTVLDRFDLRSKIVGRPTDRELVSRLMEGQPERIPEFSRMLTEMGRRIRGSFHSRDRREPATVTERRRLKVLVASWEVPSRYHGGGVYLMNLLSRIGKLHDVTLIHTYGLDEAGQSEALRPHVQRIIQVPRKHNAARYRGETRFPLKLYDAYIPELRRALELEIASGGYDLVDYEYSAMGPYVVPGIPSVLTIHENGYTSFLNSAFDKAGSIDSTVYDLDHFVRSFHYFTSELPSICDHLITLTEEDASAIAAFSSAHIYTNQGGVDVDERHEPKPHERGAPPVLAYVGNFQHPPNARAVMFFAEEVMPKLLVRYPSAEFRIYGSRISAEIRDLDGKDGVRVHGFVDDLGAALRATTALVAPIFTGTGMRIKVLDAFGAGALVIGTDLSMRGFSALDRRHFYRANTANEFVDAIAHAVEHPAEAMAVAHAGRELVSAMHGWESVMRRREEIWLSTIEDAAPSAGRAAAPPHTESRQAIAD